MFLYLANEAYISTYLQKILEMRKNLIYLRHREREGSRSNNLASSLEVDTEEVLELSEDIFLKEIRIWGQDGTQVRSKSMFSAGGKHEDKKMPMRNKNKFTNITEQKIFIDNALTVQERVIQKRIR